MKHLTSVTTFAGFAAALLLSTSQLSAQSYYTQETLFSLFPSETVTSSPIHVDRFGPVGIGIELTLPAFGMKVKNVEPGSPAAAVGTLRTGQIIVSINGVTLKDIDPRIILGRIITDAEASNGIVRFIVKDNAAAAEREIVVNIPVTGGYSATWPLQCPKSDRIVRGVANYLATSGTNRSGGTDLGLLFMLSTGEAQDLAVARTWVAEAVESVRNVDVGANHHTWNLGYSGIGYCEYYLRTGDATVLPMIEKFADSARRSMYNSAWGHRGGINFGYAGGGHLNAAGVNMVTVLLLAKECGVNVDEYTLQASLKQFSRYVGHGNVPYGDHGMEGGFVDNGKVGALAFTMAAAASLTPGGENSYYATARDISAVRGFYSTSWMNQGHTGGGIGEVWRSASMGLMYFSKPTKYREFMDNRTWHFDLSRRYDGSFGMIQGDYHGNGSGRYDTPQWGTGLALSYTIPRKTLRISGAAPTAFCRTYQLPQRPWGNVADDTFHSLVPAPDTNGVIQDVDSETLRNGASVAVLRRVDIATVSDADLLLYSRHPDQSVREMAAASIFKFNRDYLVPSLLRDTDPRVRQAGTMVIYNTFKRSPMPAARVTDEMVGLLFGMVNDPNESWWVVQGALVSLTLARAELIAPHVDRLVYLADQDEWWLRTAAMRVLAKVVADDAYNQKIMPILGEWLSVNTRAGDRWLAMDAIIKQLKLSPLSVLRRSAVTLAQSHESLSGFDPTVPGGTDQKSTIVDANLEYIRQELAALGYEGLIAPPVISTLSPADNTSSVPLASNLVVTFNETIALGTGNITIKNLSNSTQTIIAVTDATQVSISGSVLTINPTANLELGNYAIQMDAGTLTDVVDPFGGVVNEFGGIVNDTTWNFTTFVVDTAPPEITILRPADNATGVAIGANLVVTFNEATVLGTGNITIKNLTDATQRVIAVTDATQVTLTDSVMTINPTANLTVGKSYAIQVDSGVVNDTAANSSVGIADDTAWNFSTVIPATTPPTITALSPADNASVVPADGNLVVTFSEAIALDTGNITINNLTDATQTVIAVTDASRVSVAGAVLFINPASDFVVGKSYAIRIDATAIRDLTNDYFAGIADDTTWNFISSASALTHTFTPTAAGTYAWTNIANWDANGVPTSFAKIAFYNNTTTALGNGTTTINGDPATLTLDTLTLNGRGAAATANSVVNIGTAGSNWAFSGTNPTIHLNGVNNGSRTLGYSVAPNIALNQNLTFIGNGTASFGFPGKISGGFGITKSGTSTLSLGGANTFSGDLLINGGTLDGVSGNTFGTGANVTFAGSGKIVPAYGAYPSFAKSLTVNAGATAELNVVNQFYKITFTGPLTGSGTLYVNDTDSNGGVATFSNAANTFTGTVQIGSNSPGQLIMNSLADSANPIQFRSDTGNNGGGILQLNSSAPLTFNNRQILLSTTNNRNISATINNANGTASNTITINTDLAVSGTITTATKTLTLGGNNTGNNAFNGNIANGAGWALGLTKAGTGLWILRGANTYTGSTTISGGTLQLGNGGTGGSLSTSSAISVGTSSVFAINQSDTVTQGIDFSSAAITGVGSLRQAGSGTTVLTAANTFSGTTTVSSGTLQLGNGGTSGSLGTSSIISISSGAVLAINRSDTVTQGTDFRGTAITGAGGIRQAGTGTTVLNAANTYTGPTTVSAGTLSVTGSLGATAVTVSNAATLSGNGNIGGNVTLSSGARHALAVAANPGAQVTRAINGTLAMANSSLDLSAASIPAAGDYVLATATTAITGFATTTINYNGISGTVSVDSASTPKRLLLNVTSTSGYAAWATNHALGTNPKQDQDGDGVSNAVEYVLGGTATTKDLGKLPAISTVGGNVIFTFNRAQASIDGTTNVTIEVGTDLATWPNTFAIPDGASTNNPGVSVEKDTSLGFDTVTLSIPQQPGPGKFARLKVLVPIP